MAVVREYIAGIWVTKSSVLPLLIGMATLGGSQWTRTQNGQVVDLFDLTPKGTGC